MKSRKESACYPLELLRAINDWQHGGDLKQRKRRGLRLKRLIPKVDVRFRVCDQVCYRQVSLDKSNLWKLGDTLHLSEDISAWTESLAVAKAFKGGVPPAGWQGVTFAIKPPREAVVLNLAKLYGDDTFRRCYDLRSREIKGFFDGIGRYEGAQSEVVLAGCGKTAD